MKTPPDDASVENLLKGSISEPSQRFEEALQRIPIQEKRRSHLKRLIVVFPFAVAAILVLAAILFLKPFQPASAPVPIVSTPPEEFDSEWLELFTLADAVADVDSLTNAETRLAIEFYAFNQ